MQKTKRTLVILIIILALLIILVAGFAIFNSIRDKKAIEEAERSTVYIGGLSAPTAISFNCAGGDEVYDFVLEDGTWYYSGDREAPLSQNFLTRIATQLTNYKAQSKMDISDLLSAYGLDEPAYTLTASDGDGKKMYLLIGKSFDGDSSYYAMEPTGDCIYVIDKTLPNYLDYDLYTMFTLDTFDSVSADSMTSITISYDGDTVEFVRVTDSQSDESSWYFSRDGELIADTDYTTYGADGEEHTARAFLNDVRDGAANCFFSGCNGYNPTDEDLEEYDLDEPLILTIGYASDDGDKELTLLFGAEFEYDGSSFYYAKLPDSAEICRMDAARVSPFYDAVYYLGE